MGLYGLNSNNRARTAMDVAAQDAAVLSSVEVGLGALLHAFKIPLTGQFLSLNQILLLSRSALKLREIRGGRTIAFQISFVAALLKSLAPAGKKLTPMLAIAMQGLLLSLGTIFLGVNPIGLLVGATLSALWAFAQPALIYLLIFGWPLVEAAQQVLEKFSTDVGAPKESWLLLVALGVGSKVVLAWAAVAVAYTVPESTFERWQKKLLQLKWKQAATKKENEKIRRPLWRLALQDLLNPLFLISFALTIGFFLFAESSQATMIWVILRPLVIGYALFYLLRWLPLHWKLPQPLHGAVAHMHELEKDTQKLER